MARDGPNVRPDFYKKTFKIVKKCKSKHVHEMTLIKRVEAGKKAVHSPIRPLLIGENAASNAFLTTIIWHHFDFISFSGFHRKTQKS